MNNPVVLPEELEMDLDYVTYLKQMNFWDNRSVAQTDDQSKNDNILGHTKEEESIDSIKTHPTNQQNPKRLKYITLTLRENTISNRSYRRINRWLKKEGLETNTNQDVSNEKSEKDFIPNESHQEAKSDSTVSVDSCENTPSVALKTTGGVIGASNTLGIAIEMGSFSSGSSVTGAVKEANTTEFKD